MPKDVSKRKTNDWRSVTPFFNGRTIVGYNLSLSNFPTALDGVRQIFSEDIGHSSVSMLQYLRMPKTDCLSALGS